MVRTLLLVAALAVVAGPAGGCASHKDKEAQAKRKSLKIPRDRTVLTGFKPAPAPARRAPAAYFPSAAYAPMPPAPAALPAPVPAQPYAAAPPAAEDPVAAAPQFHPVDPTDYAARRPAYVSAAPVARAPRFPATSSPRPAVQSVGAGGRVPTTTAAGRYQVKKGDTLFGIARTRYGNGNQWQQIASANPGLTPSTLQAGATIVVP